MLRLGRTYAVAFSPDGRRLASSTNSAVTVRRTVDGAVERQLRVAYAAGLVFSPDGERLVVKTTTGRLLIADSPADTVFRVLRDRGSEGPKPVFTPEGPALVDGSWDGEIELRGLDGDVCWCRSYPGEMITAIHHTADTTTWMFRHSPTATTDDAPPDPDYFTVWTYPFGSQPSRIITSELPLVCSSALSPDGRLLAVTHGAPPSSLSLLTTEMPGAIANVTIAHGGSTQELAWSPDGRSLASVQDDCVRFYSEALSLIREVAVPYPSDVAFSPDGALVAIGSWRDGLLVETVELLGL